MRAPTRMGRGPLLASTILGLGLGFGPGLGLTSPAFAQDSALQRMNTIEAQIRGLQQQLTAMRRDLAARDREVQAARREAARARAEVRQAQTVSSPPVARSGGAPVMLGTPNAAPQPGAMGTMGTGGGGGGPTAGQQNASTTPAPTPLGTFKVGGVTVTLGGFVEAAGIFRSRNEVADVASNFNTGIPFPNSPLNHESEFRGSARQSRLSLLVEGKVDPAQKLGAYFETDFQSSAPTANSVESNSYNLRLRQAYATYDNSRWGFHLLGGQSWSLITMQQVGITPRKENVPMTIDAQLVPGFSWARQPQIRVTKDLFQHRLWLGLSLESPQALVYTGPNGAGTLGGTANFQNPGGAGFFSGTNYSTDIAPDIIAKAAWDPGFGHYEIYGLMRFLHDRVSHLGDGRNNTVLAGGGGAAAIIPLIGNKLLLQGSVLAGYGIGRYGSAQLPDATLSQSGAPVPLPEVQALVGLIGHPNPAVDLYAYVGTEHVSRRSFSAGGKGYGYGSPLYVNTGCYVELSTAPCQANTSGVVQGTAGAWWRFLHGTYGTMEAGAQYSYTRRSVFSGVGGGNGVDENMVLLSFRYLPFQ